MNRHFEISTVVLSLVLGLSGHAYSQQKKPSNGTETPNRTVADLIMIIEGPFVLCERQDSKNNNYLEIALPNLVGNHYPPAISSDNSEYPLENNWQPATYNLQIKKSGGMSVVNDDGGAHPGHHDGNATLYRERATCKTFTKITKQKPVLSITVPEPDEILPLSDGEYLTSVRDTKPDSSGNPQGGAHGLCQTSFCKHADRLKLRYKRVNLDQVLLKCTAGKCAPAPTSNWPKGTFVPYPAAELHLDAHPVALAGHGGQWAPTPGIDGTCKTILYDLGSNKTTADQGIEEEELEAFCTATEMANEARYLTPDPSGSPPVETPTITIRKTMQTESAVDHRDCSVSPALYCTSATCPQPLQ